MKIFVDNLRVAQFGDLEDWGPDKLKFLSDRVLVLRGRNEVARMFVGEEVELEDEELEKLGFEPDRFSSDRGSINDWEVKNGYFVFYRPFPTILKLYTDLALRKVVFEEVFPELMYWYEEFEDSDLIWKELGDDVLLAKPDETVLILNKDGLWVDGEFAGPVEWLAIPYDRSRGLWQLRMITLPEEVEL